MASHLDSLLTSRRGFLTGGLRGAGAVGLALLGGRAIAVPVAHAAGVGADGFGALQPPEPGHRASFHFPIRMAKEPLIE